MSVAHFIQGKTRAMSPAIVVLGDGAMGTVEPSAAASAVRGTRTVLIIAPQFASAESIALWSRAYVGEVVSEGSLLDHVRLLESQYLRLQMEPSEWLPHAGPAADADPYMRALGTVGVPRVAAWVLATTRNSWKLWWHCWSRFDRSPQQIVTAYVLAQNEAMRAERLTAAARADALGYSGVSALLRVVRDARSRSAQPRRPHRLTGRAAAR